MRRLCRSNHFERFYLLVYGERSWADRGRDSGASARNPDSHPPRKFLFGELTVCATGFLRSDPVGDRVGMALGGQKELSLSDYRNCRRP